MARRPSAQNPYSVIDDPKVRLEVYKMESMKVPVKERAGWWLGMLRGDPEVKRLVSK